MIAFLRHLFFHDFWLKLFSVVLAVALWVIVYVDKERKEVAPAPLAQAPTDRKFYNLPGIIMSSAEDVRAFKVTPEEVAVTLQGEREAILKLQSKDIRVLVDLTGVEAARDLTKRVEISTPPGFTVVQVTPKEVRIVQPFKN